MLRPNVKCELNLLLNHKLNQPSQLRSVSFFGFGKKKKDAEAIEDVDLLESTKSSVWDHLSNEEIEKIQNKSNLTTKERDRFLGKLSERVILTEEYQYKTKYVRNLYAQFGKDSGLKPGICWPRKEELAFKVKFEEIFHPPLDKLMNDLAEENARKEKEIKDREKEIKKGLKNLEKYKKEFYNKFNKVKSEIKEKEDKEAKRVEEVCDYLGYRLSPTDPRFEAAAEKKAEIERKEQMKSGVKKTRQMRMLEELQQLIEKNRQAEEAKEAEKKEENKEAKSADDKDENKEVKNESDKVENKEESKKDKKVKNKEGDKTD